MNTIQETPSAIPTSSETNSIASTSVTSTGSKTMNAKVSISFLNTASDANLVTASGRIVTSMTGNANFTAPFPTLAVVTAARNGFVAAVNAVDRGRISIALRDQQRAALVQCLRDLALYVQHACQGDKVKLLSSGFLPQRVKAAIGPLGPPQNMRLVRTKMGGQLRARCKAMPQARAYQWRYANAATPTTWTQSDATTAANYLLENLVPTAQYIVQARAIGALGPSEWSDAASLVVL
jgi:hypothetical protein